MNQLLLAPTDVLFFRDGRPMSGSLGGHGAAWPLPTVTNAALHAALHRADLEKALGSKLHGHDHIRSNGDRVTDARKFGSLVTVGPFPVLSAGTTWLFPRPLDAGNMDNSQSAAAPSLHPLCTSLVSSLPEPLRYAVANENGPTKQTPAPWWNAAAWEAYLGTGKQDSRPAFYRDQDFADTEFSCGIGMDPSTGTQDGTRFYSAHYLRLKPEARIGLVAAALDKIDGDSGNRRDLIPALFPNSGSRTPVIVGGQQRVCTVEARHNAHVPLPMGKRDGFRKATINGAEHWLVKWVLLSPAIFPAISGDHSRGINAHPGGWLPNWIHPKSGEVLLRSVGAEERRRRRQLKYAGKGCRGDDSTNSIPATLVAVVTGKPLAVTGFSLPHEAAERQRGEAKPTHLAVPAGSAYYFACCNEDAAQKLAAVLNWHGDDQSTVCNRRSTLMGEKGFGLGVCGTWKFHAGQRPTN